MTSGCAGPSASPWTERSTSGSSRQAAAGSRRRAQKWRSSPRRRRANCFGMTPKASPSTSVPSTSSGRATSRTSAPTRGTEDGSAQRRGWRSNRVRRSAAGKPHSVEGGGANDRRVNLGSGAQPQCHRLSGRASSPGFSPPRCGQGSSIAGVSTTSGNANGLTGSSPRSSCVSR